MLALIAIMFFLLSKRYLHVNDFCKEKLQKKFGFLFFVYGFSTNFSNIILELSTFCSTNVVGKENLKSIGLILQGAKEIFTSLLIIKYSNQCIPSTPNIVDTKLY